MASAPVSTTAPVQTTTAPVTTTGTAPVHTRRTGGTVKSSNYNVALYFLAM